jgi:hypothetical protein
MPNISSCVQCIYTANYVLNDTSISWCMRQGSPYFKTCTDLPCVANDSINVINDIMQCSRVEAFQIQNITLDENTPDKPSLIIDSSKPFDPMKVYYISNIMD